MPDLYDFILKKCSFYEGKRAGKYHDEKSSSSETDLFNQIKKNNQLTMISDFLKNSQTVAIDQTPTVSCDTIKHINLCIDEKHDHKKTLCGKTANTVSATLFASDQTKQKLLYIELFNSRVCNYRCLFVFCQPNSEPIYYSMWAYRIHGFYKGSQTTLDDIAYQYIIDPLEEEYHIPERFFFPKMDSFIKEHQLDSIQHDYDKEWERSLVADYLSVI